MKKQLFLFAAAISISAFAMAQGGGMRRSPEERLKPIHEKIDSAFKLEAAKLAQVDSIYIQSFREQDTKLEELRAGGEMDRGALRATMQKMAEERDNKLKTVLTEAQFKTWKEQIEPALRGQRGGGRPGGGGN